MSETRYIFIAYPQEFLCYEKFKRKVDFYTSKSTAFELCYVDDPNNYIKNYAEETQISAALYPSISEATGNATHAIVFDDREHFQLLRKTLLDLAIPTRVVPLELTLVVNKDRVDIYDVYIGRGSVWGNPYQIGEDGDRDEVIRKFAYDFQRGFLKAHEDFENNLKKIKGKVIACHCKPASCHGDVIAAYVNSLDDGE